MAWGSNLRTCYLTQPDIQPAASEEHMAATGESLSLGLDRKSHYWRNHQRGRGPEWDPICSARLAASSSWVRLDVREGESGRPRWREGENEWVLERLHMRARAADEHYRRQMHLAVCALIRSLTPQTHWKDHYRTLSP